MPCLIPALSSRTQLRGVTANLQLAAAVEDILGVVRLDLEEGELLVDVDRADDLAGESGLTSDRTDDVSRTDPMHPACGHEEAREALVCDGQLSRGSPLAGA